MKKIKLVIVYYKTTSIYLLNFKVWEKDNSALFVFIDMLIGSPFAVFTIKARNLCLSFIKHWKTRDF